jgi:hypothetical protein
MITLNPKKWYYKPVVILWAAFLIHVCIVAAWAFWHYCCFIWGLLPS